ncbi:MAG TPA: GAF domain-containing protein [Dehalococcoidia bacterium]
MSAAPGIRDAEYETLVALSRLPRVAPDRKNLLDVLQATCDLAREITEARYAAMAITDDHDRTEGFFVSGLSEEELKGLKTPPQGHGPLGDLRYDGRVIRIDDVKNHPTGFGFPPRHPEMQTMLGVPIWVDGQVRGSIYVTDKRGSEPFEDGDETRMLLLARHVAAVVKEHWA